MLIISSLSGSSIVARCRSQRDHRVCHPCNLFWQCHRPHQCITSDGMHLEEWYRCPLLILNILIGGIHHGHYRTGGQCCQVQEVEGVEHKHSAFECHLSRALRKECVRSLCKPPEGI